MVATLRIVLDQLVVPTDAHLESASRELTRALIQAAPTGCEVAGIVPAVTQEQRDAVTGEIPGIAELRAAALARRELAGAWQLGVPSGVGGGMIHSASLFAPLVKHDRIHDHDQTVVTLWDLRPWESPDELPRATLAWHRAMLKRAAKHADAVVVPTHAMAEKLGALAPRLADRIRVIAGAAPAGFAVPTDEVGRRRTLDLPDGVVVLSGGSAPSDALAAGFGALASAGLDLPVVVLDAAEGEEPAISELASAAGIPARSVHVRGALPSADRAAILGAAVAFVAPSRRTAFPWRMLEALTVGVPIVAVDSGVHTDVLLDGGLLTTADDDQDAAALGAALAGVLGSETEITRRSVLSADRGRVFSWREAAERVWQLHADL